MANIIFILVCFAASLTNYLNKNAPLYLKLFPLFLLTEVVCEYTGLMIARRHHSNVFLYNMLTVMEFGFFYFFFYSVYRGALVKKIVAIITILYLAGTLFNIFFIQGRHVFHTYSFMVGCLLVIAGSIYYFLQMFRYPQPGSILREPAFWITAGLLFYYACVLPIYGVLNYIASISPRINHTLAMILNLMVYILYSLFTLAFLCKVNFRKYTSS
ncbi:MAG TPA: hypothetical protein VGM41_14105 [Chitinophagaceae bacterium]